MKRQGQASNSSGLGRIAPCRIQIRQGATIVQSQEDDGAECQSWSNRAKNKVLDGALYVATDTGTLWMGISSSSLIQIKDNINTNTTYNLTKSGNSITLTGSDGSSFSVTDSNTVYGNATSSVAGLMSAADKAKLDGVSTGSNHVTVDATLSADSTNPVQNKVIKTALDGKSNTGHTHDDRYYTETEMNTKLAAKANSSHTHTKS